MKSPVADDLNDDWVIETGTEDKEAEAELKPEVKSEDMSKVMSEEMAEAITEPKLDDKLDAKPGLEAEDKTEVGEREFGD